MSGSEEFNGASIMKYIKELSQHKRAAPLECFITFLHDICRDNTEEEALSQWKVKVEQFPWYADDALFCMDWVIENPPEDLRQLLEQHGWIPLYHEDEETGEMVDYTPAETLDWLRTLRDQYKAIYTQAK